MIIHLLHRVIVRTNEFNIEQNLPHNIQTSDEQEEEEGEAGKEG